MHQTRKGQQWYFGMKMHIGVDSRTGLAQRLQDHGVTILRPPRDGRMAFVRSPDGISVELLQAGAALAPQEPWVSMGNTGNW
jgi:lactoylglutathione lyase